jgi:F-type H+-transporting ATPase subunit gamma
MRTLEAVKRKLESAEDLQSVVKTMKAMAAVSIRQYEQAVDSLHEYNRTLEQALQVVMQRQHARFNSPPEESRSRLGAFVFGSEQGMCGQFNEEIASFALERMQKMQENADDRNVVTLGMRTVGHLEDAGQAVEDTFALPSSVHEITWSVQELLLKIEAWRNQENIERIVLFYNKKQSGSSYEPHLWFLLPLNISWLQELAEREWPTNSLPTYSMNWDNLFASLIRHYFFFHLYRAFAESLASENASRLAAMQAAEKNIKERLDELNSQYNRQRQSSITSELLDIVSGFEALEAKG